jgi:tyrosyl-tRNA synthetase
MLSGLKGPAAGKMSKSIADSAIFMEDSPEEVERKIMAAFCNDEAVDNPIFEYIQHILLRWFKKLEFGGKTCTAIEEISADFDGLDKKLLKLKVIEYINQILQPVRDHFASGELKALCDEVA